VATYCGLKRQGHSSLPSAERKNRWKNTSILSYARMACTWKIYCFYHSKTGAGEGKTGSWKSQDGAGEGETGSWRRQDRGLGKARQGLEKARQGAGESKTGAGEGKTGGWRRQNAR
jgi:hypothetical protein